MKNTEIYQHPLLGTSTETIYAMESPEYESTDGTPNIMIAYIDPHRADFVTPKRFLCGTHKMNSFRMIVK